MRRLPRWLALWFVLFTFVPAAALASVPKVLVAEMFGAVW